MAAAVPAAHPAPAAPILSELERYIDRLWQQAQLGEARVGHTLHAAQPAQASWYTQSLPNAPTPALSQPSALHSVIAPVATAAGLSHVVPPTLAPAPVATAAAGAAAPPAQPVNDSSSPRAQAVAQLRCDIANEVATMAQEAQRWHTYLQSNSNEQIPQAVSAIQPSHSCVT